MSGAYYHLLFDSSISSDSMIALFVQPSGGMEIDKYVRDRSVRSFFREARNLPCICVVSNGRLGLMTIHFGSFARFSFQLFYFLIVPIAFF